MGSLTKATGRDNVRLDLPGSPESPARSIRAPARRGWRAGEGLTAATFTDNVDFAKTAEVAAARVAKIRALSVACRTIRDECRVSGR